MSKKSYWDIKDDKSDKIIGFGASILKDKGNYEWILETFIDKRNPNKICLRLMFENWKDGNNPEIVPFQLNKKMAKELIKSLKQQVKVIKKNKKKKIKK